MRFLRQSTASQTRTIGPFIDDTDFKTAATGLTVANTDIRLKINGANDAAKNSGGATHDVNGCYHLTFDATDTATVGELFYTVKVAGALQVFGSFWVLEEAVYDQLFAASALGYIANAPVNTVQISGSSTAADNLEIVTDTDFADSYNTTANKWEVDLTHTLGIAVQDSDFTIASATSSTVTLPTTYANSVSLPDDDRYIYNAIKVVGGTGEGQVVLLTTAAAGARQYNVQSGSMPVQLDNTSKCVVVGSWQANATLIEGTDATDQIRDAVVDDATRIDASALNTASSRVATGIPNVAAGASGGLLIAGSNAATTFATLTVTGTFTISDGLVVARSSSNSSAVTFTGNGTGHGFVVTSGSGATGDGMRITSAATNGVGLRVTGTGSEAGLYVVQNFAVDGDFSVATLASSASTLAWNSNWDTEVQSEVDDALVARGLDHLVAVSATGTDIADNSIIARLASKSATADWDTYDQTTDSLEAQRDNVGTNGVALTAADDAVITLIGSAGAGLTALATAASITTLSGYVDTEVAAIKAKTDQMTFSETGTLDANILYVNNVQVGGAGTEGDPWSPA